MPKIEKHHPARIHRHEVEETKHHGGVKAAVVSNKPTGELTGHLPKIEKLDVEKLTKAKDKDAPKGITGATVVAHFNTGVDSPSGIAHMPSGELFVVDDDKGVFMLTHDGQAEKILKDKHDCEGLCVDDKGKYLWTVEELERKVTRYEIK